MSWPFDSSGKTGATEASLSIPSTQKTWNSSSWRGMDVVMMNDIEQRHLTSKSRSHSPYGHIGSPTTPLNFEQLYSQGQLPSSELSQLYLQGQLPGGELSQHDQVNVQAQMLNGMRSTGMALKSKQQSQSSLAMLDQLRQRQAYHRGEQGQVFNRGDQQQGTTQLLHKEDPPNEPSTIALLQQKFAQLERHKAEMQISASQPHQVQIYPSQWPMSFPQHGNSMQAPPVSSATYTESPNYNPTTASFYPFQQQQPHLQQHQQVLPPVLAEVSEPFYSVKQEMNWRPTQGTRSKSAAAGWTLGNAAHSSVEMGNNAPLIYMTQQQEAPQQFQHRQSKVVDYQPALQHRVSDFSAAPQQQFTNFQLNGPPAPDVGLLASVVSSRCDKTGGHSVEIKSVSDHYRTDESEMSLDNFSGRVSTLVPQPQVSSVPNVSQISHSNNFHMLPQSSKSAFSTFTRPSSNLNPATEGAVTKSLLFNDTYSSLDVPDVMHDDIDTELHL